MAHPELHAEVALRMAVKGMNDTMGPEGLAPTLLVLGNIPTLVNTNPPPLHNKSAWTH